jgi:hypothetical protein
MNNEWKDLEPAPLEFFHGLLMDEFHKWRRTQTEEATVQFNGMILGNLIAKCKLATYEKYKNLHLEKAVEKSRLTDNKL